METYSNRELDGKFSNLLEHMRGFELNTATTLGRIEAQTMKTNGRVSQLERWQSYVIGFCAAIGILILPLLWTLINHGKL